MDKMGSIYRITNKVNGKVYIGQTINSAERRMRAHLNSLKRSNHTNEYLQNAFNKYGEENFSFDVLMKCPLDELDNLEIKLIAKEKSGHNCYNIEPGGSAVKIVDGSTRKKLSRATKMKHKKDKLFRENYLKKRVRKIICLNNMVVYDGLYLAAKELNLSEDGIFQNVKRNNRYVKGEDGTLYQFEYYLKDKEYKYHPIEENCRTSIKEVICLNTKERFSSVKEAAEKYNLSNSVILRCCRKVRRYGGRAKNGDWLVWRFAEDYDEVEKISFNRKGENWHRSRPVICITTGKRFQSITAACEEYGLNTSNLTRTLKGEQKYCGKLNKNTPLYWKYA